MNTLSLDRWIGKTEIRHDHVTVPMAERMAATLDRDDPPPRLGDKLPTGWHSMLFPRIARRSLVGRDGHPKLGDFLPPMPLPRRMFAGRRTRFIADLLFGDAVTCTSVIASITPKAGKTGPMIFLTLRHSIASARGLAIVEEQDVVYREETTATSGVTPTAARPMDTPRTARWMREHVADEVTLFRYSALTFNGHRIHYDLPYVTEVENYPGLVVNGGLTTLYIYELLREHAPRPLKTMGTRNLRPMFGNQPFTVCVEPGVDASSAALWVIDAQGEKSLEGHCELA